MRDQGQSKMKNNSNTGSEETNMNNLKQERHNVSDSSIRAADSSRNDERDQRIGEEPDTKRLRSEKESAEQNKTE
jgi:hypothetical protein